MVIGVRPIVAEQTLGKGLTEVQVMPIQQLSGTDSRVFNIVTRGGS